MRGHDGRPKPQHDWKVVAWCPRCHQPTVEMRINGRYARQEEHTQWCRGENKKPEKTR